MNVLRQKSHFNVSSLEDIKEVLDKYYGAPVAMTATQNIVVEGVTVKAWSKIYSFQSNGSSGDQVMLAAYPNPNQGAWLIGIGNGYWRAKTL